jgi:hypothetical protein
MSGFQHLKSHNAGLAKFAECRRRIWIFSEDREPQTGVELMEHVLLK